MKTLATGLVCIGNGMVDNCPAIARNDARRQLSRLVLSEGDLERIVEKLVSEAAHMAVCAARAQKEGGTEPPTFVSRIANDRARLMVIHVLDELHRPPSEVMPTAEYDDTARSRIFKEMRIYSVNPIDAVAVRVAGSDPD